MYDGGEHTPKLLPCSHTVCLQCLDRIVATRARDNGQFRCPTCMDLVTIPRGGVQVISQASLRHISHHRSTPFRLSRRLF